MHALTLFFSGFLTLCSAQSTTTLFLPGFDQQEILASIAGSDATATTYALACPSDIAVDNCGVPVSFTLTEGPATAAFTYSAYGNFEQLDCSLGGTTTAFCTVTATPVSSGNTVSSTGLSGATLASQFQAVTLTDNLPVETGLAQTSAGISLSDVTILTGSVQSSTMAAQTSMPSGAGTASTTGGLGASSATAATKTSAAGMSHIMGKAGWAVRGVALALAVAGL